LDGLYSQFLKAGTQGMTQRKTGIKKITTIKIVKARLYIDAFDNPRYS